MKTFPRLLVGYAILITAGCALADSFFVEIRASATAPATNYTVPPGKIVFVADYFGPPANPNRPNDYALTISYERPEGTAFGALDRGSYVLGPCTLTMRWTGALDNNVRVYWATLRISDARETTASPENTVVVPTGLGAKITLQSSTDLKNWTVVAEETQPPTATNRFYRLRADLQ